MVSKLFHITSPQNFYSYTKESLKLYTLRLVD